MELKEMGDFETDRLNRMFTTTFDILFSQNVAENEFSPKGFNTKLITELKRLNDVITAFHNQPLSAALMNTTFAMRHVVLGETEDAKEFFKQALQNALTAFTLTPDFEVRMVATRLQLLAIFHNKGYFSNSSSSSSPQCNLLLLQDLCETVFDTVVDSEEVQVALWESLSAQRPLTMRPNALTAVCELRNTIGAATCRQYAVLQQQYQQPVPPPPPSPTSQQQSTPREEVTPAVPLIIRVPVNVMKGVKPVVLLGHRDSVNALAISGGFLFSASLDSTIKVWLLNGGKGGSSSPANTNASAEIATLTGHKKAVYSLATAGGHLFSGSEDNTIKVWNIATFALVATLVGHADSVDALTVSNNKLYSGSGDATIKIWDLASLVEIATLTGHSDHVTCLVVSGNRLFSGAGDSTVKVWDLVTLTEIATLGGYDGVVTSIAVDLVGSRLFTGCKGKCIKIWDLVTLVELTTLVGHTGFGVTLAIAGGRFYAGSASKSIKVWDLATMTEMMSLSGHGGRVLSMLVHAGRLFTSSIDNTIHVRIC